MGLRVVVTTLLWCYFLGVVYAQNVRTAAGVEADPCAGPTIQSPADCQNPPARGVMSTTIMLPAADSTGLSTTHPAIFAGTQQLTIEGERLTQVSFYLAENGGTCNTAARGIAVVDCITVNGVCTVGANGQSIAFPLPTTRGASCNNQACWNSVALLSAQQALGLEQSRLLCAVAGVPVPGAAVAGGFWTGLRIGTGWNCESATTNPNSSQRCTLFTPTGADYNLLRSEQVRQLRANTQCCKSTIGFRVGVCINAAFQSCCGVPVRQNERCCSSTRQLVQPYNAPCPCRSDGGDADCPTGERCCLPFKYSEFRDNATPSGVMAGISTGTCYNRTVSRCCDTGSVYDPGAQQCCSINGVQSLNIPCPCDADEDCIGGQREYQHSIRDIRCCRQTDPEPYERRRDQKDLITANGQSVAVGKYANFPSGTGLYNVQRCTGQCIDVRFQICCNGVACVKNFERCCNSTCCNRFSQSCEFGYRAPTTGNSFNYIDFKVSYYQCSDIEALNPLKSFWIYILPTALLLATAFAFGIVMVFANKAANRSYSTLERAIIAVATIIILMSIFLYFSPAYKYGLVAVVACLFAVLAAAARIRWLNIIALGVVLLAILYTVDPFPANNILGFASYRNTEDDAIQAPEAVDDDGEVGAPNIRTMGLLHTVDLLNRDDQDFCVDFYDYFRFDPQLRDEERCDNPEVTSFGYCDRGFIFILLLAAALIIILLLLLFILLVLALFLRFIKPPPPAPVELEIVPEPEPLPVVQPMMPVVEPMPMMAPMVVDPMPMMMGPSMGMSPIVTPGW